MSEDTDPVQVVSFFIVIGVPMLFAYLAVDMRWAVQIGTFTCAWWGAWQLWIGDSE